MHITQHIHFPTCRVWVDGVRERNQRCTCPRRWRIRRDTGYTDGHVWLVHRLNSDGVYDLFVRADDWSKAVGLVEAMAALESAIRSPGRKPECS